MYWESAITFNGLKGIVRYWAVVGADISSSLTVCTLMLYARPGIRPLNAAWAGPGGSPSLSTYMVDSGESWGSIFTYKIIK